MRSFCLTLCPVLFVSLIRDMIMSILRFSSNLLLLHLLLMLTGCVISHPAQDGKNTLSFSEYVEDVFRRQNNIVSEILIIIEDDADETDHAELIRSEQNLQEACKLLNEYAVRERDELTMGLIFKRKVKNSVAGCEKAIENAESLLDDTRNNLICAHMFSMKLYSGLVKCNPTSF